jgi:hypothetical protein
VLSKAGQRRLEVIEIAEDRCRDPTGRSSHGFVGSPAQCTSSHARRS